MPSFYTGFTVDMAEETTLSISKKEKLIEAVRLNPCLYDKTDPDFKDKNVKVNTWKKIAREIDLTEKG